MEFNKREMFIVKNFLCCLSLRAGIIFISWWTFLYSFFMFIIFFLLEFKNGTGFLTSICVILLCGTILSGRVLWYLQVPGKNCSTTSVNARSLIYFLLHQELLVLFGFAIFVVACIYAANNLRMEGVFVLAFIFEILFTAWQLHCISVIYSYHSMITKADETVNDITANNFNLTTNNGNSQPNAPMNVTTEPIYTECASAVVNNQTYDILNSATTSKKSDLVNFV